MQGGSVQGAGHVQVRSGLFAEAKKLMIVLTNVCSNVGKFEIKLAEGHPVLGTTLW